MIENALTERFKELISAKSASVLDFSRLIGVAQTTLNSQLSSTKGVSSNVILLTLDTFPDVSAEWLLRGKGEMLIASSPNEFALVRLTTKKGRRELETGSVNLYAGTSIGVDEKNHIQIDIEKIDDYTFKVKPRYFLNTGEYCFYYQGSIPQGGYNNQSVFDFSIPQSCALEFYNKYSKAILKKYKGIEGIYALPVPVNQRMNKYIKEICKACEINEPICRTYYKGAERIDEIHPKYELIGTHCGRKTFICNALMLGIAPNIVMKWTGHRDYKSMKPYIDIADKAKEEAMNLFNR